MPSYSKGRVCTVEGCKRGHCARGLCSTHYHRWRLHDDALYRTNYDGAAELFRRGYRIDESGCWIWEKAIDTAGYGRIHYKNISALAHRFSWELSVGPIPAGMFVCHRCDTPPCVNPGHLFVGDNAANTADKRAKNRQSAKLTTDDVREIRRLVVVGVTHAAIADTFAVSVKTIRDVALRKTWAHVMD